MSIKPIRLWHWAISFNGNHKRFICIIFTGHDYRYIKDIHGIDSARRCHRCMKLEVWI